MKKNIILATLLTTAAVSLLGGCSGNGAKSDPSASSQNADSGKQENVELRVAWWGGEARHKMYNEILDNFQKKYPNITVMREFSDFGPYFDKLATQTAGGNAPDVVHFNLDTHTDYINRGALLPLDDFIKSGEIDLQDFNPAIIDTGKVNGETFLVSLGNSITGTFYNSNLFERMNVAPPEENWTWEDFIEKSKELVKAAGGKKDFWASEDMGGVAVPFTYFLRGKGKDFYTNDGGLAFDQKDLSDWLTMWDTLRKAGTIPPAAIQAEQGSKSQEQSLFAQGKVAMHLISGNQLSIYQKYTDDELNVTRMPSVAGGKPAEYVIGAYMGISEKSKHPKEAAMLINYFMNDPEAAKLFKIEHGPRGSQKMNEVVLPQLTPADKKVIDFVDSMSSNISPIPSPPLGSGEVFKLLTTANESVAFGKKSIEQAAADFFAEASGILS